jgi:hypothetical protein
MKIWNLFAVVLLFAIAPGTVALLRSDSATEAPTGFKTPT